MFLRSCAVLAFKIYFKLFNKIEKIGTENLPKEGAYVLVSNHVSWLDPLVYVGATRRMMYALAKEELFSTKLKSFIMKRLAVIPVKRDGNSVNQESITFAIDKLKEGNFLLIFPEGTRMGLYKGIKPKKGASLIAVEAQVPIIPIAVVGSFKKFSTIKYIIGKPIDTSAYFPKEGERVNPRDLVKLNDTVMGEVIRLRDSIQTEDDYKEMIEVENKRLISKGEKEIS